MAKVQIRPKGANTLTASLDRVPVAGDYLFVGYLGRVLAVVLTPNSVVDAVVYLVKDPDGTPDEIANFSLG
jgi:hypothetical protein